tara:strand:+ start:1721 stop:1900 length:180 start_codon:yes stop_codon:yes gene_type:complete
MAKSTWRNTKYIIILTAKQLALLEDQVMTEFAPYTDECDPSTRKVFAALQKQIDERIEV